MSSDNSRLLLKLEEQRRQINREILDPSLGAVDVGTMLPIVKVCSKARSNYINCLMSIAKNHEKSALSDKQIDKLRHFRIAYEELVRAANAVETVVDRGYVNEVLD